MKILWHFLVWKLFWLLFSKIWPNFFPNLLVALYTAVGHKSANLQRLRFYQIKHWMKNWRFSWENIHRMFISDELVCWRHDFHHNDNNKRLVDTARSVYWHLNFVIDKYLYDVRIKWCKPFWCSNKVGVHFLPAADLIKLFGVNLLMILCEIDHFINIGNICSISMKRSSLQ